MDCKLLDESDLRDIYLFISNKKQEIGKIQYTNPLFNSNMLSKISLRNQLYFFLSNFFAGYENEKIEHLIGLYTLHPYSSGVMDITIMSGDIDGIRALFHQIRIELPSKSICSPKKIRIAVDSGSNIIPFLDEIGFYKEYSREKNVHCNQDIDIYSLLLI